MSYFGSIDPYLEIKKGNIPGHQIVRGFGEREDIGDTIFGEDIWRGNELTPIPTNHTSVPHPSIVGEQMTVVSESDEDNGTIRIHYLDVMGNERFEDKLLNGTTEVDTVATDIRYINDMHFITVTGPNNVAAGHVKIYKKNTAGAVVYSMIAAGGNKAMLPHRMVPKGKTLYLKGWRASEAGGKRCAFRIRSTDMYDVLLPDVFCFKDVVYLKEAPSPDMRIDERIPELSVAKISGWSIQSGAEGSCSWWGILVDNAIVH